MHLSVIYHLYSLYRLKNLLVTVVLLVIQQWLLHPLILWYCHLD